MDGMSGAGQPLDPAARFQAGISLKGSTMTEKTASVHWQGRGRQGQRQVSTGTGALDGHPCGLISLQARLEGAGA
jgi:hypothetical protein